MGMGWKRDDKKRPKLVHRQQVHAEMANFGDFFSFIFHFVPVCGDPDGVLAIFKSVRFMYASMNIAKFVGFIDRSNWVLYNCVGKEEKDDTFFISNAVETNLIERLAYVNQIHVALFWSMAKVMPH